MTISQQTEADLEFPLASYPGIGKLALDLVSGSGEAASLVRRPDWSRVSLSRPSRDRASLAQALISSNRSWGNDVAPVVSSWASGDAVAVIAGQQVGLGGGPLYTLAKVASLFAACRRLEAGGVAAVPFFWLATEDHDFAEVTTLLYQTDSGTTGLRSTRGPALREPVGELPVPEDLRRDLAALIGEEPEWLRPGVCFGDSFAMLLIRAVGSGKLVLVDSLLPQLRREGGALLLDLASRLTEAEEALSTRSNRVEAAGYRPQVDRGPDGRYSLLYSIEAEGERTPITARNGGFTIGSRRISAEEMRRMADSEPERLSTGALARPLLQDFVFEPAVFIGGPAEVAYYAQAAALHEMFGVDLPGVALRGHALVAPAKRLRALERHGVGVLELFRPLEEVVNRREGDLVRLLHSEAGAGREAVDSIAKRISALALEGDPGLARAMERSSRRIEHHLGRMTARAERAIARRDEERWRALSALQEILYPSGQPQDRVAGWLGWWLSRGDALVEKLIASAEPDSDAVRVAAI